MLTFVYLPRFHFNSRTPRGVRLHHGIVICTYIPFQLTHPTRSATWNIGPFCKEKNFNSRTPRGVRPVFPNLPSSITNFNSRTPRGVRLRIKTVKGIIEPFQLTHPTRSATDLAFQLQEFDFISTHAPHAECDHRSLNNNVFLLSFQLTHPTRSATLLRFLRFLLLQISTHAPHAECDHRLHSPTGFHQSFQLTHPTRSATYHDTFMRMAYTISTHAPHAECDHHGTRH